MDEDVHESNQAAHSHYYKNQGTWYPNIPNMRLYYTIIAQLFVISVVRSGTLKSTELIHAVSSSSQTTDYKKKKELGSAFPIETVPEAERNILNDSYQILSCHLFCQLHKHSELQIK